MARSTCDTFLATQRHLPRNPATVMSAFAGDLPFDWDAFLKQPTFTEEELQDAKSLASQWVSCACSNACKDLPKNEHGAPRDSELRELGTRFCVRVEALLLTWQAGLCIEVRRDMCIDTLDRIEERAKFLLNQLPS